MNLSLVDPFALAQDYPDTLTGKLRTFSSYQKTGNEVLIVKIRQRPCFMLAV